LWFDGFSCEELGVSQLVGVVAQPWRRAEKLVISGSCVAPLRLGGLRGKQSTPSVWLGGTGEPVVVGKRERGTSGNAGQGTERGTFQSGRVAKV
jgi:hypothetical protein